MKQCLQATYHCQNCATTFKVPVLSDFAYGEFILGSKSGEYRYFNAFEDLVYQEVIAMIAKQPLERQVEVQSIFGALACDYDASVQAFTIGRYYCPKCTSSRVIQMAIGSKDFISVSSVTHIRWHKLDDEQKEVAYFSMVT